MAADSPGRRKLAQMAVLRREAARQAAAREPADPFAPLAAKAESLDEARKALESAATMARGLWLGFISLSAYLAIAVGSVTHRDLFLETPLTLPLLGVKLPLVAFFWISPILFLIVHGYLLLHLKLTADNVREWERVAGAALAAQQNEGKRRPVEQALRLQLPNFLIVQMLAAPAMNRGGLVGFITLAAMVITVVFGPVLLLMLIQLQFLPYHHEGVTWVQRVLVAADIGLLFWFWPKIIGIRFKEWQWHSRAIAICGAVFFGAFSWLIALFPGETLYEALAARNAIAVTAGIFEGEVDNVTNRPTSALNNRLVLQGEDFVDLDEENLAKATVTLSMRGRWLQKAVFVVADLRKSDFSGAQLQGATLDGAKLQGATLDGAKLQSASLWSAQLQGAFLTSAQLQGAALFGAQLQGADLEYAQMQGAYLGFVRSGSALYLSAQLQGAYLYDAKLQGAYLDGVQFQGAGLEGADLRGASLYRAELLGASLYRALFQGASLREANVWRVRHAKTASFDTAYLHSIKIDTLNAKDYSRQLARAVANVMDDETRKRIEENMAVLDPAAMAPKDTVDPAFWQDKAATYNATALAAFQKQLACGTAEAAVLYQWADDDGKPHVVTGLLFATDQEGFGTIAAMPAPHRTSIANHILAGLAANTCPGAVGLDVSTMTRLREWAAWVPEPKPDQLRR